MATIVQVSWINVSDPHNETVDVSLVVSIGDGAEPTSRVLDGSEDHGYAQEWSEEARMPDGRKCYRMYLFTAEEVEAAGENSEDLPWDDEHVARIILAD